MQLKLYKKNFNFIFLQLELYKKIIKIIKIKKTNRSIWVSVILAVSKLHALFVSFMYPLDKIREFLAPFLCFLFQSFFFFLNFFKSNWILLGLFISFFCYLSNRRGRKIIFFVKFQSDLVWEINYNYEMELWFSCLMKCWTPNSPIFSFFCRSHQTKFPIRHKRFQKIFSKTWENKIIEKIGLNIIYYKRQFQNS